jgi:hypothetical protein
MLIITLATICLFCSIALIPFMGRGNKFNLIIFLLVFAVIDVYFPAIYWTIYGQVNNPEWLPLLREESIQYGIIYYSIFYAILIACFLLIDKNGKAQVGQPVLASAMQDRLRKVVWVLFFLTLAQIGSEILRYGGVEQWLGSRLIFALVPDSENEFTTGLGFLTKLPLRDAFQASVGVAFFYRKNLKYPKLFGFVFPALAVILAMSTFLRGAVLTCAITLIFSEVIRRQCKQQANKSIILPRKSLKLFFAMLLAGVVSIYIFGAIRDGYRGAAADIQKDDIEIFVPTFFTAGHGLLGLSHIVSEYGNSVEFLYGRTYFDMILLPVPRVVYTSKPKWYGIDDITRGMGWPESTQSAVTMPGEAFANFGIFGLLVAFPLGFAFGWLQKLVRKNPISFLLLGPIIFFQLTSVANWMSFTGIMNSVPLIFFLFILSIYIRWRGDNKCADSYEYSVRH